MSVSVSLGGALGKGRAAIIDDADADNVLRYRWSLRKDGYAHARVNGRVELMHRFILGLSLRDTRISDHLNRDRLDNRRANLRILLSRAENAQNKGPYRRRANPELTTRGVCPLPSGRFRARIRFDGRLHHLGVFDTESEAAAVAAEARVLLMPFSEERTS